MWMAYIQSREQRAACYHLGYLPRWSVRFSEGPDSRDWLLSLLRPAGLLSNPLRGVPARLCLSRVCLSPIMACFSAVFDRAEAGPGPLTVRSCYLDSVGFTHPRHLYSPTPEATKTSSCPEPEPPRTDTTSHSARITPVQYGGSFAATAALRWRALFMA